MSEYNVTLVFDDGRAVRIPAKESETIYLSALKKRIRLETDCREGTCATCRGLCTRGEYWMEDYIDEALTADEAARREVLTCRMHPSSDCVIEMPYESGLALRGEPERRQARVAAVEEVAASVVRLDLELEGADGLAFLPGQYVHLEVPGTGEQRSYSFANPPEDTKKLSFYIKILSQGLMSEYVSDRAKPGDSMAVTGPFGRFYLRQPVRPIVMVAGGTGLAPMLSMFEHLVAGGCNQPIRLLYGANTPVELVALDRLKALPGEGLDLTTELAVVQPDSGWTGAAGHVTALLRPELLSGGACDVYLCGPPPMIDAAEAWLSGHGLDPRQVHAEKFLPS